MSVSFHFFLPNRTNARINLFQDIEIIAIDPDSYYSSPCGSSDSETDSGDDNSEQEVQVMADTTFNSGQFEMQPPPGADFDIITLNIDDDFQIDTQDDDILFKNDHQFDLASYIGGESTSLLLSPVNDAVNLRHRMKSLNDSAHTKRNVTELSRALALANANHDKVTKTPASNRRKRKNLSREFIETSDSDEDNKTNATVNSIDDSKCSKAGKLHKDNDPVWCPPSEKRNAKAPKQTGGRVKEIINRQELKDIKNAAKPTSNGQGKGLRDMLKQQLLSDRPVLKAKLFKTLTSSSVSSAEKVNSTTVAPTPVKKIGVGRGKDIAITAKYYNCTESSDNDERDKPYKHNRYHQIYTDSDDSNSDVDVSSEPNPLPKGSNQKEVLVAESEKCKEIMEIKEIKEIKQKPLEAAVIEKKTTPPEPIIKKPVSSKTKSNVSNKPIIIDNTSMDSTDFARALVTEAKAVPKVKSTSKVAKKNHLEQQKRIIQSNLLLQNPSKFKMLATHKSKAPSNGHLSNGAVKPTLNCKVEPSKVVKVLPKKVEKESTSEIPITKIETETQTVVDVVAQEVQHVQEMKEDVKPDVTCIDDGKVESNAKRKLNLQEYLKRKSVKTGANGNAGTKSGLLVNIKTEKPESGEAANSNRGINGGGTGGNSMYEEIIIVSMGCNTDISIPESSFIHSTESKDTKSTVLLSDIQTSVERANSKISCCSLISSIQDVILKKSHCMEQNSKKEAKTNGANVETANGKDKADEKEEHGENKVIMHLRKDRVRPMRISTSIQTDPYFQFPPLEKLASLSKKQSTLSVKRMNSIPRDSRSNEIHILHSDGKNRSHRNYRGRSHFSESSYYSDEEEKGNQRPSRHSEFMEQKTVRHSRVRRESSRYSSSKYDRYLSRHRTISRSLSSSSDNSTTSTDSSSSSQSSSSSSTYVSSTSARSLNSYGGSSSKSYYGDDHQYYRIRTTSNNSRRSNYRKTASNRTNSPGLYLDRVNSIS